MPPTTSPEIANAERATAHSRNDALETIRSSAADVGDRLPSVLDAVRTSAAESARTVQAWPEPTQRLLAAFSLGLGVGLTLGGAPRLVVAGALLPVMTIAAAIVGRDPSGLRSS